jgi:2-polyprenyl-3-methyl-5-hydroxy-6-metoxy-1,4-benzoquinol methylase
MPEAIIGKITAAPNPVPAEAGTCMRLKWEVNERDEGEVYVSENGAPEKLVSKGRIGSLEIEWIQAGTDYTFRLYNRTEPRQLLDSIVVRRSINGRIRATPNPIPLEAGSKTLLEWEITSPAIAEIYLSENGGPRKLVCKGLSGSCELNGLQIGTDYVVTLCTGAESHQNLDTVTVRRMDIPWNLLLAELRSGMPWHEKQYKEIGEFIAAVVSRYLHHPRFLELFRLWEKHGFHVTPVHFYQPIPDAQSLPETVWSRPSKLVAIDMNDAMQLDLLRNEFPKFRDEYEKFPTRPTQNPAEFYLNNQLFDGSDALVAYCMVRHFQPRLVIEVGSGFSSLVLGQAVTKNNNNAGLICIEPFPREFLKNGFPGLQKLIEKNVQDIDVKFFSQLEAGDMLFIDSSHTVKTGGDVNYLFLEVLPRLNPGVIVHVHDIFLPFDYRRDWVLDELRFWSEQYLLQGFLTFNSEFEVLMANSYMAHEYLDGLKTAFPSLKKLKATLPNPVGWGGGSFWMRRKPDSRVGYAIAAGRSPDLVPEENDPAEADQTAHDFNPDQHSKVDRRSRDNLELVEMQNKANQHRKASPLYDLAVETKRSLWKIKLAHRAESFWYPYSTLSNIPMVEELCAMAQLDLLEICRGEHGKVADIGAADGDLAFFLENQGLSVDVIDNEATNFNRFLGVRILKDALNSSVAIHSVDLDRQFDLPGKKYDVIFLLGMLYHLKNPFFVLEKLAQMTRYCFVSTRIAKQTTDGHLLSPYPVAYLLGPRECNDDFTNYWIFTNEGLKRLIDRTGWSLLSQVNVGDTTNSTPADLDRDERAFVFLRRVDPKLSASPNPVPPGVDPGKTTITWSGGKVYVSVNGGNEVCFADTREGSMVANWILKGASYEFRVYNSNHTEVLAKLTVSKATQ